MSIGSADRRFGTSSLYKVLSNVRHGEASPPQLSVSDRARKSEEQLQIKQQALDAFKTSVVSATTGGGGVALLQTVLNNAKVDVLPLISARHTEDTEVRGGKTMVFDRTLDLFIDGNKPVSFSVNRTVTIRGSGDAAVMNARIKMDINNYSAAHALSAQAVQHLHKPGDKEAAAVGVLREAIYKVFQNNPDLAADTAARARILNQVPTVRDALTALGLGSFATGVQIDAAGNRRLALMNQQPS